MGDYKKVCRCKDCGKIYDKGIPYICSKCGAEIGRPTPTIFQMMGSEDGKLENHRPRGYLGMTPKEMCNGCIHGDYCMDAYRKNIGAVITPERIENAKCTRCGKDLTYISEQKRIIMLSNKDGNSSCICGLSD